jgi:hypothetical protein
MVKNMKKKLLIGTLSIIPLSMLIYWFNLDNKLLYYGVRPLLNKIYNSQQRNVKL